MYVGAGLVKDAAGGAVSAADSAEGYLAFDSAPAVSYYSDGAAYEEADVSVAALVVASSGKGAGYSKTV